MEEYLTINRNCLNIQASQYESLWYWIGDLHEELYLADQHGHDERDCQQDAAMRLVEYEHSHVRM